MGVVICNLVNNTSRAPNLASSFPCASVSSHFTMSKHDLDGRRSPSRSQQPMAILATDMKLWKSMCFFDYFASTHPHGGLENNEWLFVSPHVK